jgi:hypothetical protein
VDYTNNNLEYIQSIRLDNITEMEKINAERELGRRIHFSKGVWWQETKPFFYTPVQQFEPFDPLNSAPKLWLSWGGYYHVVSDKIQANGFIILNEISAPSSFSLEILNKNARYEIRKGLAKLEIKQLTNLEQFLNEGFQIYRSWLNRTPDAREKKSDKEFKIWFTKLFNQSHNLFLGAFYENQLVSFIIADAFENIAYLRYSYSHSEFNNLFPSSVLNYAYIMICTQDNSIKKITNGLRSHRDSLNKFKLKNGYQHITYPAFIKINPLVRPFAKIIFPRQFKRLMGEYSQ